MDPTGAATFPEQQYGGSSPAAAEGGARAAGPTLQPGPASSSQQPGSSRKRAEKYTVGEWRKQLTKSNFKNKRVFLPCAALKAAFGWEAPEGARVPFFVTYTTEGGLRRGRHIDANPRFNTGKEFVHRLGKTFTDVLLEMGAEDKDTLLLRRDSTASGTPDKIYVTLTVTPVGRRSSNPAQRQQQQQQHGPAAAAPAPGHPRRPEAQGAEEGEEEYSASWKDDADEEEGPAADEVGSAPAARHAAATEPAAKRQRTEPAAWAATGGVPPAPQAGAAPAPGPAQTGPAGTAAPAGAPPAAAAAGTGARATPAENGSAGGKPAQTQPPPPPTQGTAARPAAPGAAAPQQGQPLSQADFERIQRLGTGDTGAMSDAICDMVFAAPLTMAEREAYLERYENAAAGVKRREFMILRGWLSEGDLGSLAAKARKFIA
ncbi:hypothetical protein ABPG75_007887 [Micractinium tetrahymenae]